MCCRQTAPRLGKLLKLLKLVAHFSLSQHGSTMVARDLGRSLQRTLTHLRPPPIKGGKFAMPIPTHFRPAPRFVAVEDRIPFWHIAPNDLVTVIKGGDEVKGKTGTVDRVDRETNRVYLKQDDFKVSLSSPCGPSSGPSLPSREGLGPSSS